MTKYQVVYWRDIPAQVKARLGTIRASRELSPRFQEAIDAAAMQSGAAGTDEYLAFWRTLDGLSAEGSPESVVDAVAAKLEAEYTDDRLAHLKKAGGTE